MKKSQNEKKEFGYIGRISNSGSQKVEAPHLITKKSKGTVKSMPGSKK